MARNPRKIKAKNVEWHKTHIWKDGKYVKRGGGKSRAGEVKHISIKKIPKAKVAKIAKAVAKSQKVQKAVKAAVKKAIKK
mgnify:CR=1 FL=1